jgi:hypothetical protein
VKGFCQIQGVDYDEMFSPFTMLKSIRILLAIAMHYDYKIWQMDVKTTLLNGNLCEDVHTPDVSYALIVMSKYQLSPGDAHWVAVKNILKCLRRTKDQFLIYMEVRKSSL